MQLVNLSSMLNVYTAVAIYWNVILQWPIDWAFLDVSGVCFAYVFARGLQKGAACKSLLQHGSSVKTSKLFGK